MVETLKARTSSKKSTDGMGAPQERRFENSKTQTGVKVKVKLVVAVQVCFSCNF